MISGTRRPAKSNGIPKKRPMLALLPSVRLITNPAMKRIKPIAIAKENL
jgi:hypothetical protein